LLEKYEDVKDKSSKLSGDLDELKDRYDIFQKEIFTGKSEDI
jgi:hypothetical protein